MLHYVFARMELAEERGLGLKSMRNDAQRAHLPLPKYTWEVPYLVLTIYRSESGVVGSLDAETLASLSRGRTLGVEVVDDPRNRHVRRIRRCAESAEPDCTEPFLEHFTDLGLVRKQGSGPATRYEVVRT